MILPPPPERRPDAILQEPPSDDDLLLLQKSLELMRHAVTLGMNTSTTRVNKLRDIEFLQRKLTRWKNAV